jgi:hypothetical protein
MQITHLPTAYAVYSQHTRPLFEDRAALNAHHQKQETRREAKTGAIRRYWEA